MKDKFQLKIMLEQKADFFKIRLKLVNARTRNNNTKMSMKSID